MGDENEIKRRGFLHSRSARERALQGTTIEAERTARLYWDVNRHNTMLVRIDTGHYQRVADMVAHVKRLLMPLGIISMLFGA